MAQVMLTAAIVMGLSYATEWFNAWYGGDPTDRNLLDFEFTGAYAPIFWIMLACNVAYRRHSGSARCGSGFSRSF